MSVEHYTPAPIIEAARRTMGTIDLDPASCPLAQEAVGAAVWLGPGSPYGINGLALREVPARCNTVFLNPPGGRSPPGSRHRSNAAVWWEAYAGLWARGEISDLVFVAFNIEFLRTAQATDVNPLRRGAVSIPRKRLKFRNPRGTGENPANASAIVYLGPRLERFRAEFEPFGTVIG